MATVITTSAVVQPLPHLRPPSSRRTHLHRHPLRPSRPSLLPPVPKSTTLSLSPLPQLTSTTNLQFSDDQSAPHQQQSVEHNVDRLAESYEEEYGIGGRCHYLLGLAVHHRDMDLGRAVHAVVVKSNGGEEGGGEATLLFNKLISMYVRLGRLLDARKVFECMQCPDVVSYSSLISAYGKCGQEEEALGLFFWMWSLGIEPNEYTFVAALACCIGNSNFQLGSEIHALAVKTLYCTDVYVANALMALCIKDHRVNDAVRLFDEMTERDVSSWNTIISGMVNDSSYCRAFELFHDMQNDGFCGDQITISSLLKAAQEGCFSAGGRSLHAYGIKTGLERDTSASNALISFYTCFGSLEDVVDIFHRMPTRDVISWTVMITGYMEFGHSDLALEAFHQMKERNCVTYNSLLAGFCHNGEGYQALELFQKMVKEGMELSDFTLTSALNACAMVSDVEKSRQMHAFVVKVRCGSNAWVEAALLDMCVKCNRLKDAREMLDRWNDKNSYTFAWTSMVCGYARNARRNEALSLFNSIIREEEFLYIDEVALATILGICGDLGSAELGKQIHCYAVKSWDSFSLAVGNAIFSMYSKCGNMKDAMRLFNSMDVRDIVSWNALITAQVLHRQGDEALAVWKKMEVIDIKPDYISFVLILSACKYTESNSVNISRRLFASMANNYGIEPSEEHYASLVEVLGHWDCFHEAEELIKNMPIKPSALVWKALLDSCRLRSNLSLGRRAVQRILALRPADSSTYVLISNLYSSSGRWHCSEKVREEMREKGIHKHPVQSWVIHQNRLHTFYARDRSHLQSKDIYGALDILILECMKSGYIPDTSFVLHEVEEFQKKDFLFYHSAKLAVSYGLLTTSPGKPIFVMKNVHVCGDCHSFFKYVSIVTRREIVLRDATGFHCFTCGECSCRDYW